VVSRIILQKAGMALVATDEESVAALAAIKDGTEVYAEIVRARNTKQHRLFMTLCGIVAESMDLTKDRIRKDALIRLGYTNTEVDVDGRIHVEAKSMKHVFHAKAMTQEEFDAFMGKAVNLMAGWVDAEHQDLMRRYNEIAADKRYEGMRRR
jgi:hypothetical protein